RVSDVRLSAHGPRRPAGPRLVTRRPVPEGTRAEGAMVTMLLLLMGAAIAVPLLEILIGAVIVDRRPTLEIVTAVLAQPLFARALGNTLLAGGLVVACGSLIALPLAWLIARCDFPGRFAVITLGLLPLVVPPFVGAMAFQQVLGLEITQGLRGVVLVQTLHYFPGIMVAAATALSGVDRSLEEAAQMLGASGLRLHRRILFPQAWGGYAAGALLTFVRVVDDLGTPLMLGYENLLAPQAYLRVASGGVADGEASVICVVLVALSLGSLWLVARALRGSELSPLGQAGKAPAVKLRVG